MSITSGERERILLCRETSPHMTIRELCHYYMIHPRHAIEVLGSIPIYDDDENVIGFKARKHRVDAHKAAERYALVNVYEHVTAQQLAHSIGVSLPTAYKAIEDRPDYFRKIKRGVWECRNAAEDRKQEKGN